MAGCSSVRLRPALTEEELDFIRNHKPLNVSVDVKEDSMYPAYSRQLYETLKGINVFKEVTYNKPESSGGKTEYVAEMKWRDYHTNSPQFMVTFVTFGIIPSWKEENHGVSFLLRSTGNPPETRNIEVAWSGTTFKGWVMSFANFSSDRSSDGPYDSKRYSDRMKLAVAKALAAAK